MIHKVITTFSRHGVRGVLFRARVAMADWWFDLKYGVDTCKNVSLDSLRIVSNNKLHGYRYEPGRVVPVRMALNVLRGHFLDPISVVDFGCGKARILMIAAECGFARATGVEFSPELCLIARANCRKFEQNFPTTTTLTVVESDAVDYAIKDDDNLFFFFNPFDATVMTAVLRNIAASLKHHPRFVILAIYNTDAGPLVAQFPEFSHLSDLDYWGYRVCLFTGI